MLWGMRALVVYESIFGNTRQIAEAIGEGLRADFEVELVEAGQAEQPADDVDLIVVGGPTHAWSMSRNATRHGAREQARQKHKDPVSRGSGVREWLQRLKPGRAPRMAAAFDTAIRTTGRMPTGSAARAAATRLEDRGCRLVSEPGQFFVQDIEGPLSEGELERARAWGARVAERAKTRSFVPLAPRRRSSEAIGTIVGNSLALLLINTHEVWRPWTLGVVTEQWAQAVATMNLACAVGIAGSALVLMFRSRALPLLVGCALAAASLASAAVVYTVFPFDFGALAMAWFDPVMRMILLIGLVGTAIGLVVRIVRLIVGLVRD
jgi:hypothetical protein